jgi:hypothetical protein
MCNLAPWSFRSTIVVAFPAVDTTSITEPSSALGSNAHEEVLIRVASVSVSTMSLSA